MDTNQHRRAFLKRSAVVAAGGAVTATTADGAEETSSVINMAGYDYDRVRGIIDGKVGIDGANVRFTYEDIYAVNDLAFGPKRPYEVSELGLIPYITQYVNKGFRAYTLIPVFISRIFRHRNVYVRTNSGIESPADLRGKRVGTPGYGMSANTWIRGFLQDEYGVAAHDFEWIETTKSSDDGDLGDSGWSAFGDDSPYFFPKGFPIRRGPVGVDESELLLSGQCDALITAITPKAVLTGDPRVKTLFPSVQKAEQDYYRKTGLFPIMHVVGIRTDAIESNPDLPRAVFNMYCQAKHMAYHDLETTTSLKITLPWVTQEFEDTRELMGDNFWRYGMEANRKELETIMRYCHEQWLIENPHAIKELFHPSTWAMTDD